jgi:UDP-N-acetylglucosamine:LPS N-acetylglucosamine transferase
MKICLAASGGGHLSQMLKLSDSWQRYETFYITTAEMVREQLQRFGRVYVVGECNRRSLWRTVRVLLRCLKIIFLERPDVVISTGAAAGCISCFLGKLIGAKVIWVDSITNIERLSVSGRMVKFIADLFFVQWPELTAKYRGVQFAGTVV